MTEYFEVLERDGAARVGELRLTEPRTTPALVGDLLEDAGSLWSADRSIPETDESTLTILPHRAFPAGTAEEVRETFAPTYPEIDDPSVAVLSSASPAAHGTDGYVLSDGQALVGHGRGFAEAMVAVRETIPSDTALLLSGVATPRNVATLVYAGVDLLDESRAVVAGTQGRYLTTEGSYHLDALEELSCPCPVCEQAIESFTREDCVEHNRRTLAAEVAVIRRRIRDGRLRDYIEGQARHDGWLTAAMRVLDEQWSYLEERTPILRHGTLTAATEDTLRRVEIQRYADRVTSRYRCRFDAPAVLVPCSARKPYSDSQSHRQFHEAIRWRGHIVSLTSPLGVVPQELETTYPAQHYDAVVTGRWSDDEIDFVARALERYLDRTAYPRVIAHVPEGGYRQIVERVAEAASMDVTYTVDEHPTDDESLAALADALEGEPAYQKRTREHNTVRAVADYLLGDGAGDDLFGEISTTGRYPGLQVRDGDGIQLATMVPQYGTLSFTLEGAHRWLDSAAPTKRIRIEDFVPHGSVLAPGVVEADETIRIGDEVVVEGPSAFGVGRAAMFGREMVESTRGIACEVRHVEER